MLVDYYAIGSLGCDDELDFYHYSAQVHVDKHAEDGPGLLGVPTNPFSTVSDAYDYYPIWDGAEIIISAGSYKDSGVFSKRIRMRSVDGSVILGKN